MYALLHNPQLGRNADCMLTHFGMRVPNWSKWTVLDLMQMRSDATGMHEMWYDLIFALPSLLFLVTTEFLSVLASDYLWGVMLDAPTVLAYEKILPSTSQLGLTSQGTRALHIAIATLRPAAIVSLAFCLAAISHANNVLDNIISVINIGYIICECGTITTLIINEKHRSAFNEIASILPHGKYTSANEVDGRRFSLMFFTLILPTI
ncbi:hypothetical protein JVU11DRAFT_8093 [Chiua virens]|nr:hypothetical protein JVU11DRAFT_8093 [Chiua virens]